MGTINYEPKIALDGGLDGLEVIRKVISKSKHLLKQMANLSWNWIRSEIQSDNF